MNTPERPGKQTAERAKTTGTQKARLFENTTGVRLAEKILDRSKPLDPELLCGLPRIVQAKEELDHKHYDMRLIASIFALVVGAVIMLAVYTYVRYHELPWLPLAAVLAGIALAAGVVFTYVPPGCDCRTQRCLVKNGNAVNGQITEKLAVPNDNGTKTFQLEYAFQPEGSDESLWGRMTVSKDQFDKYDEGEDITVLYLRTKKKTVSRVYRCCVFAAEPGRL